MAMYCSLQLFNSHLRNTYGEHLMHTGKLKNSEVTKENILRAAVDAFSAAPFQNVNLRSIAKKAKVDVALINRYFGPKIDLFEAVLNHAHEQSRLLQDVTRKNLMDALLPPPSKNASKENITLLCIGTNSVADQEVRMIIQKSSMKYYVKPLIKIIGGPSATRKALLITSILMGYTISCQFVFPEHVTRSSEKQRRTLIKAIQMILDE